MNDQRPWCHGCWAELPAASPCPRCGRPFDPQNPETFYQCPKPITVLTWLDLHIPVALLFCAPMVIFPGHLLTLWLPAVVGLLMLVGRFDPIAFREGRAKEGAWKIGINALMVAALCALMAAVVMASRS